MADNIYDYLKENFNIETDYQFKRDYIKNPLIRKFHNYEKPYKDDFVYLYNNLNLTLDEMSKIFNSTKRFMIRVAGYYNTRKTLENYRETFEKTSLKLYGVSNYMNSQEIKNKLRNKFILKYGVSNPSYLPDVIEKRKNTSLEHFGVSCPFQSNDIKNKIKNILLDKYGAEYISQTKHWKIKYNSKKEYTVNKLFETKRKNGSLGKSKEEDKIYQLLKEKYPQTIHHYKSKEYPFVCDFFIPEIDTYIEYQGYFTHGGEPYIGTDKQKEKVKLWESKNTKKYNDAIKTWTDRDVLKRNIANKNKLNYLEFFNYISIIQWIHNINTKNGE